MLSGSRHVSQRAVIPVNMCCAYIQLCKDTNNPAWRNLTRDLVSAAVTVLFCFERFLCQGVPVFHDISNLIYYSRDELHLALLLISE